MITPTAVDRNTDNARKPRNNMLHKMDNNNDNDIDNHNDRDNDTDNNTNPSFVECSGILPALLYGRREVLQSFLSSLSETERRKLEGWVGRGSKDASGDRGEAVGISMQELNTEVCRKQGVND